MSGELSNKIRKEIVRPETNAALSTTGYIEEFNKKTNKVSIKADSPYGEGTILFQNVELPIPLQGASQAGPYRGDKVLLAFTNNNFTNPRIVQFLENDYFQNIRETKQKHETQGSYLPDIDDEVYDDYFGKQFDEEEQEDEGGIFSFLIKIFNKIIGKKQKIEEIEKLEEDFECIPYFDISEVGLTHPKNKTTIKIKDDGSIDLFSFMNEGIRVNPVTRIITHICEKVQILTSKIFFVNSKGCVKIDGKDFVNLRSLEENVTIISDNKNVLIRAKKENLEIEAKRILLNGHDLTNLIKQEIETAISQTNHQVFGSLEQGFTVTHDTSPYISSSSHEGFSTESKVKDI